MPKTDDFQSLATVLAFDPGGTTGWCAMSIIADDLVKDNRELYQKIYSFDRGQIDCGTRHGETGGGVNRGHGSLNLPGENRGVSRMSDLATEIYYDSAIVIEDFILERSEKSRELLSPVRITSSFTYAVWEFSQISESDRFERIFVQNRSPVKTTCNNERMKFWGFGGEGYSSIPHAMDATRHAYYFLRNCSGNDIAAREQRFFAWPHLFEDPRVTKPRAKRRKREGQRIGIDMGPSRTDDSGGYIM